VTRSDPPFDVASDAPTDRRSGGGSASAFRMASSLVRALAGQPVRVGTENPAKLAAVRSAIGAYAERPETIALIGVAVASGVPEQPIGWAEIAAGARNRARAALGSGVCALAVGIEDGLVELPVGAGGPRVFNVGCAWMTDGRRDGTGFSAGFAYPPACARPAWHERLPIGDLFDALWADRRAEGSPSGPSGRQGGNVGQLTQGRLDRAAYGAQAILCALVPFLHADLYD